MALPTEWQFLQRSFTFPADGKRTSMVSFGALADMSFLGDELPNPALTVNGTNGDGESQPVDATLYL